MKKLGAKGVGKSFLYFGGGGFVDVGDIQHRLGGQEAVLTYCVPLLCRQRCRACGALFVEVVTQHGQDRRCLTRLRIPAARLLLHTFQSAFGHLQVSQDEFQIDDPNVVQRVQFGTDMRDVGILEAADDVDQQIGVVDVLAVRSFMNNAYLYVVIEASGDLGEAQLVLLDLVTNTAWYSGTVGAGSAADSAPIPTTSHQASRSPRHKTGRPGDRPSTS